jgi:hypothetical protein
MNERRLRGVVLTGAVITAMAAGPAAAQADVWGTNFESPSYTANQDIGGQAGWTHAGPHDANVVSLPAYPSAATFGFGSKALQMSNFTTTSAFGDQTFSPSVADEAGEAIADGQAMSGGIRQSRFLARFRIAAADPSPPMTGEDRHVAVSPDRGDGSRMSYLRFEDQSDGIHVFFIDVNADDTDFPETDIATLSRSASHLIDLRMDFVDGPANDVVTASIDGTQEIVGGSWEQYYRIDSEQAPNGNVVPTVDSLLFREAGASNAGQEGKGFLIDDVRIETTSPGANQGPPGADGTDGSDGTNGSNGQPGPAGPSTPAAESEVTPVVITSTSLKPDAKGRIAVKLSCPKAAGLCDGRLTLKAGRTTLGRKTFLLDGAKRGTVKVKVSKKLLKKAAKAKKVAVSVFSRDAFGKASRTSASLKFRKR